MEREMSLLVIYLLSYVVYGLQLAIGLHDGNGSTWLCVNVATFAMVMAAAYGKVITYCGGIDNA